MESRTTERTRSAEEFVDDLDKYLQSAVGRILAKNRASEPGTVNIPQLLRSTLKKQLDLLGLAASWIAETEATDIKLAFAREVGDESRHYRLIEDRLRSLPEAPNGNGAENGKGLFYAYLTELKDPIERLAAELFTHKAIEAAKNEELIRSAQAQNDEMTAHIYSEMIQKDERFHHGLAKKILKKYCSTPDIQDRVKKTVQKTLSFWDEA